jgi:hypothetical protein
VRASEAADTGHERPEAALSRETDIEDDGVTGTSFE